MKNIAIIGAGYVGLANGLLLARKNDVSIFDINPKIINDLRGKKVHIDDEGCQKEIIVSSAKFMTVDKYEDDFDFTILAVPTNYNVENNMFDVSILDDLLAKFSNENLKSTIIIKSTVPIGFTKKATRKYTNLKIIFSPEFLREGSSFSDAANPSRIIVGSEAGKSIGKMFYEVSENDPEILLTNSTEAEAIKLFSNTYLAMRVAFVNELDTFAQMNKLNSVDIIKGVSLDPRIGKHYFSPSFGYGGYCLPKDSKQLRYEFTTKKIPSSLFDAIVESNEKRKYYIAETLKSDKKIIIKGIAHKSNVSNFRNSPKLDVAHILVKDGFDVEIQDDNHAGENIEGFKIKKED